MTRSIPRSTILFLVGLSALFLWSYRDTLLSLVDTWNSDPDYQHGYLIVPIAVAILWRRRDEMPVDTSISWWGLGLVGLAGLLRWVGLRFFVMELDAWSILIWLCGAVWLAGGFRLLCWALPAIAFLGFATPLPDTFELALGNQLQPIAAMGSAFVLQCLGQPAILNGTTVLLGDLELDVEHACSGLRMFFGTFAMAFGYGMLGRTGHRITTLLVLMAVPVSICANIIRIVLTGLLFQITDDKTAWQLEHDFAGLVMIGMVLSVFIWTGWQLQRWRRSSEKRPHVFARRIALWPVGIGLVVSGIVYLHYIQTGNVVGQLVTMAERAESTDDYDSAARYWDLAVRLDPNNPQALKRLSLLLAKSNDLNVRNRALRLAGRASGLVPLDLELAAQRAEIAIPLSAHRDTIAAAQRILGHPEIHAEINQEYLKLATRWRANAVYSLLNSSQETGRLSWRDLARALEVAIQHDPLYPQHYFRLAVTYRTQIEDISYDKRLERADSAIELMMRRNAQLAEAWLVRYRYAQRFMVGDETEQRVLDEIDTFLDRALDLHKSEATKNVHILVAAAERERRRGNAMDSVAYYEQAIVANPMDARPYLAVSEMVAKPGDEQTLDKSIEVLQEGVLAIGNREFPLILPLIRHLSLRGRTEEANRYLQTARRTTNEMFEPQRTSYRIQLAHVEALLLARRDRFADAAEFLTTELDRIDADLRRLMRAQVAQAWGNVAQYWRMSGDLAKVTEAYQRAAALDSSWRKHMLHAAAQHEVSTGDFRAATSGFEALASSTDSTSAWVMAARFALRQQLLLPPASRDWSQYRHAIESARGEENIDDIICLEANQRAISGQWVQAERLLKQAVLDHPNSPLILRTLALLYTKQGDLDSAIELVNDISSDDLQAASLVLLKSELLCSAGRYEEALDLLQRSVDNSQDSSLANELRVETARILTRIGEWDQAKDLLKSVDAEGAEALRVVEMLSRLAWCQQDWRTLQECEDRLHAIEGSSGALWRTCRIRRILGQSDRASPEIIREASDLAGQLRSLHPDLQVTRVSSARVATFRGLLWEAVAHYEHAWSLGSPRVTLAVDLIALLNELGQTDRAQRYVDDARHFMRASEQMIDRSLVDFVYDTDVDAIRFAEAWVRSHQNSEGYLRYGRTLALAAIPGSANEAERLEQARAAFEKAVELNPNDIRAWGAYYRFYAAARPNPAKAQEVLDRLARHKEIGELDRTFGLAQLQESVGQSSAAAASYAAAIEQLDATVDELSHLVVYERAAQFYRNHDPQKAAECSRLALEIDPASVGARSVLIEVLLEKRTASAIDEADRLFGASTDDRNLSDDECRLRATLLQARAAVNATGDDDLHTQAVATLRKISRPTTDDNLMVAESLLLSGTPAAAANQITLAVSAHDLNVPALVRFLRVNKKLPQRFVEFEPVFEQAFLRVEEVPGHEIEALQLRLDSLRAIDPNKRENELKNLDSLMIDQLTQRCLVRIESHQQREMFTLDLFDFLLQSQRIDDAARLTKMAMPPESPLQWGTSFAFALASNVSRVEITDEAEKVLQNVVRVHPHDPKLNFAFGNLRYMQGRNGESITRFRDALERNPDHIMTMNNLALALAASSDANLDESFALVKRAMELGGRTPILLDSLALLLMQSGDPQTAISTLNEAGSDLEVSIAWLIHLASAWRQAGDQRQSERVFELIDRAKLSDETLTPTDLEMYRALDHDFSN